MVDGGRVIKRMRPAPQGRGYRIRKRSNHVTLIVDSKAEKVLPVKKAKPAPAKVEEPVVAETAAAELVVKPEAKPKKATAKKSTKKSNE